MDFLGKWIMAVTVSAMIIAVAEALMPPGAVKKVAKLTGGLVLMLGILQPIVHLDYQELYIAANGLESITIESAESQEEASREFTKAIIEQELGAYVLDKALALGITCRVTVTCQPDENGVPIPAWAEVRGTLSGEAQGVVAEILRKDLGIDQDHQTYINEEVT